MPTFGKGVVFDVDHKVRAEQFRFFAEALKTQRMKLYVPQFVQEAEVILALCMLARAGAHLECQFGSACVWVHWKLCALLQVQLCHATLRTCVLPPLPTPAARARVPCCLAVK